MHDLPLKARATLAFEIAGINRQRFADKTMVYSRRMRFGAPRGCGLIKSRS